MHSKRLIFGYWLLCCLQVFILRTEANDYQNESRPSHCLAETRELYNYSSECPGFSNHQPFMECSYKFGRHADPLPMAPSCSISGDYPGKPFDLQWSVYTVNSTPTFNITWRLPQDGSSNFSTGFALHMKYVGLPNPTYVRIFNVSPSHLPDVHSKIQFYYDCFPAIPGLVQRITVFSLPLSPSTAEQPNYSVVFARLDPDDGADDNCSGDSSWKARAVVKPSPLDAHIDVSFDPAPDCYHFTAYNVSLVKYDSEPRNTLIQRVTLFHPPNNEKLHHLFTDVCPDLITIMIRPFINETCQCVSSASASSSSSSSSVSSSSPVSCRQCTVTSFSPFDMTQSRCRTDNATTTTCLPKNSPARSQPMTTMLEVPPFVRWLAGAGGGLLVAVLLLLLITYKGRRLTTRPSPQHKQCDIEGIGGGDDEQSSVHSSTSAREKLTKTDDAGYDIASASSLLPATSTNSNF